MTLRLTLTYEVFHLPPQRMYDLHEHPTDSRNFSRAHLALSPDPLNPLYVAANLRDGFEVYGLPSGISQFRLTPTVKSDGLAVPSMFIHRGRVLLVGNSLGQVKIWDVAKQDVLQTLEHEGSTPVQVFSVRDLISLTL